jgi:hypothetical protein
MDGEMDVEVSDFLGETLRGGRTLAEEEQKRKPRKEDSLDELVDRLELLENSDEASVFVQLLEKISEKVAEDPEGRNFNSEILEKLVGSVSGHLELETSRGFSSSMAPKLAGLGLVMTTIFKSPVAARRINITFLSETIDSVVRSVLNLQKATRGPKQPETESIQNSVKSLLQCILENSDRATCLLVILKVCWRMGGKGEEGREREGKGREEGRRGRERKGEGREREGRGKGKERERRGREVEELKLS